MHQLTENSKNANPPASEDQIASLTRKPFSQVEGNKECSVCQDEFDQNTQVIQLPCTHIFHENCIVTWLKVNGSCPVCRFKIGESAQQESTSHA